MWFLLLLMKKPFAKSVHSSFSKLASGNLNSFKLFRKFILKFPVISFMNKRLIGISVFKTLQEARRLSFLWTEQTSESWSPQSSIPNGGHSNSIAPVYAMK